MAEVYCWLKGMVRVGGDGRCTYEGCQKNIEPRHGVVEILEGLVIRCVGVDDNNQLVKDIVGLRWARENRKLYLAMEQGSGDVINGF